MYSSNSYFIAFFSLKKMSSLKFLGSLKTAGPERNLPISPFRKAPPVQQNPGTSRLNSD